MVTNFPNQHERRGCKALIEHFRKGIIVYTETGNHIKGLKSNKKKNFFVAFPRPHDIIIQARPKSVTWGPIKKMGAQGNPPPPCPLPLGGLEQIWNKLLTTLLILSNLSQDCSNTSMIYNNIVTTLCRQPCYILVIS